MSATTPSWTNFRECFAPLLRPRTWRSWIKKVDFWVRCPAVVPSYDIVMGLVFHFLRRGGTFSFHMKECTGHDISDSALSQRRQTLPWKLFELLLDHVLKPRAQKKAHPEAFWKGWRLTALDGTQVSVPNTPQVLSKMSKAMTRRFSAAFAKVRLAVVVEIGLHNPLGVAIGTQGESEIKLARQVLDRVPEGSLLNCRSLLRQRGFYRAV